MAEALVALATLAVLEIVLGIDNIVFISIMAGKLPVEQQAKARSFGLMLAMVSRILLLLSLSWVMRLTTPLFAVFGHDITGRDLILIVGGLFLLAKSTMEIHHRLEGAADGHKPAVRNVTFTSVILQIGALDIIFSLDSVITAVGMARDIWVMITAVVIAIGVMLLASGKISAFVDAHPTVKMLALSFLLLIGFSLVSEGLGVHIPKGYIYFAMAFSVFVEMLNLRIRNRSHAEPVQLKQPYVARAQATPEQTAS